MIGCVVSWSLLPHFKYEISHTRGLVEVADAGS